MNQFQQKVAVITGAASGFGREFARIGATKGMKLVLADMRHDALDALKNELELHHPGIDILAMTCDVRHAASLQELADATMRHFGAVHLLFNNAGVGTGGLIWENTQADWEWVLGVNLWGVIHGTRIFMPLMLSAAKQDKHYRGHIVNTASVAGLLNAPTMGIYNVSKHAVVSFSESLYHDLKLIDAPIGASVLCPHFVPTAIGQSQRHRPEDVRNVSDALTPSQRASQRMSEKAIAAGKLSAADVGRITFNAIEAEQFYIYSHPEMLPSVRQRMNDLVTPTNPSDPFAQTPKTRAMLRSQLLVD